jgi:hypothetical protein
MGLPSLEPRKGSGARRGREGTQLQAARGAGLALNRMRWHRTAVGSSPLGGTGVTSQTLYGYGLFQISDDPLVIMVPAIEDRAWSLHGHDDRGRWWFLIGSQFDPPCPHEHFIVGPGWTGKCPTALLDTEVAQSPSAFLGVLCCLVLAEDRPHELTTVRTLANSVVVKPFSQWQRDRDAAWSTSGEVASRARCHG